MVEGQGFCVGFIGIDPHRVGSVIEGFTDGVTQPMACDAFGASRSKELDVQSGIPVRIDAGVALEEIVRILPLEYTQEDDAKPWSISARGETFVRPNKAGIACGLYALALVRDEGLLDPAQVSLILAGVMLSACAGRSPWV